MGAYLEVLFPRLAKIKIPLTRDQLMLIMAAINEIFLGIDIYLAHLLSGTIVLREWIPILFGPIAGLLLLLAGWFAGKNRKIAVWIANIVFILSIIVGFLGTYFHFIRAILPTGPAGSKISIEMLIWAPPIIGPLVFSLVGLLGITAIWREEPLNSGRLILFREKAIQLPFSKTRAFFLMVSLGTLATLISSVLDHARNNFQNPWVWVPVVAGVLGVIVPLIMAVMDEPKRGDLLIYFLVMGLLILVGVIGAGLHILDNLTSKSQFVAERFIRGAPFLAPLLFANMGTLGLLNLFDPAERKTNK
ncbi:MAG: hypothetical protein ACC633_10250 [Anaerolineales bacterium]